MLFDSAYLPATGLLGKVAGLFPGIPSSPLRLSLGNLSCATARS
jgi:hypothetical protein